MDKKTVGFRCDDVKEILDKLTGPGLKQKIVSRMSGKPLLEED
jgi:hypothetical protein